MRCRGLLAAVIVLVALFANSSVATASNDEVRNVLLLYDSLAKGTTHEGSLESLERLLVAMGVHVKQQSIDSYQLGGLNEVNNLIVLRNVSEAIINETFVHDLLNYKGAYLHIGYDMPTFQMNQLQVKTAVSFAESAQISIGALRQVNLSSQAERFPIILQSSGENYGELELPSQLNDVPYSVKKGKLVFVPYFGTGIAAEIAMGYVLTDWLGVNKGGEIYLLFKEIYPFTDLKRLESVSEQLYEAGIPFLFSIRPVFENTEYPAMKRYLEVLKYVQSRNGSIIVHAPVLSPAAGIQNDLLKQKMTNFVNLLAENDIVPLGIGADSALFWRNERQFVPNGMSFFDSALLFQGKTPLHLGEVQTYRTFLSSPMSVQWNDLNSVLDRQKGDLALPVNVAVTFDFATSAEQWDKQFQELKESWILFDDFKYSPHRTYTDTNVMESKDGLLLVNNKEIILANSVSDVVTDYQYREQKKQSFNRLFAVQNKIYLIIISFSLFLFGGLFVFGYRLYKRKYLK
ncbi:DUF2334 domain-containing protein [Paenibacillus sp. GSMTC-2017]|nr:DUF2334 domain-containing protein [Paenibacillus sp. GSMTC-2017]MBH5317530.1 DUF2334 domain-containing protein [Paenibacillus sp. GSMTC-2017]